MSIDLWLLVNVQERLERKTDYLALSHHLGAAASCVLPAGLTACFESWLSQRLLTRSYLKKLGLVV